MDMTRDWFMKKIGVKKAVANIPTPDTMQGLTHGLAVGSGSVSDTSAMSEAVGCPHLSLDAEFNANCNNGEDPFAFMREGDFDMDK